LQNLAALQPLIEIKAVIADVTPKVAERNAVQTIHAVTIQKIPAAAKILGGLYHSEPTLDLFWG
jgi:hypothetical protein